MRTGNVFPALALLSLASRAIAQDAPPPPPVSPPPPASPAEVIPALAPAPPPVAAPPVALAAAATPPAEAAPKWYDLLEFGAFVDSYYSLNWNSPKPQGGQNRFRPYDANNGFSLAWAGVDLALKPDPVGAVVNMRFGPAVPNLALADAAIPGNIGNLQQAYVSWKPEGKDSKWTLILGKFDTVFGAEVAASQNNINYTRGALYNLAQPFFHTGLRADVQINDIFGFKLLAVNGWNNTVDNNKAKSFGAQVTLNPSPMAGFAIGYLGGAEQSDVASVSPPGGGANVNADVADANSRWRHLIDVVADFKPTDKLRILANGDFVSEAQVDPANPAGTRSVSWLGASLMARYAFTDVFAAGLRGEYIIDNNNQIMLLGAGEFAKAGEEKATLATGTLTLEAMPTKYLVIRLDNRIDSASEKVFLKGTAEAEKTQFTTTLGVVAKTN
jgi:hypothetical protein